MATYINSTLLRGRALRILFPRVDCVLRPAAPANQPPVKSTTTLHARRDRLLDVAMRNIL